MRRIGLIGGISWTATADYYRFINLEVFRKLGGHHSADMVIRSLDFHPLLQQAGDLPAVEKVFREAGESLHCAGASVLAVASFTGHRFVGGLQGVPLPLVDIVSTIGQRVRDIGIGRIAVWATSSALGDRSLMHRLAEACCTDLMPPAEELRAQIDQIIFSELAQRKLQESSTSLLRDLLDRQIAEGAEALLLATTEFSSLASMLGASIPMIDAAEIHCAAIVDAALA